MIEHRFDPDPGRARDGYQVTGGTIPLPDLEGDVQVAGDHDRLIDRIAADLVIHTEACVREFGDAHLAFAATPRLEPLYERLMYDPNYRRLPWRRVHFWFVDELDVDRDDDRSAFKLLHETIGLHADVPREQFHPITPGAGGARTYERALKEALSWREKGQDRLDCVLLDLGADGRIGGLLPASPALDEQTRFVCRYPSPHDGGLDRTTLTLPIINTARFIAVQAVGRELADVVARCANPATLPVELPVGGLAPRGGELRWYLDAAACPMINDH